jgi:negative regulator of flagellin synthesis FlgM
MKINGASVNKVINLYNVNKQSIEKKDTKVKNDSIEISTLGKKLSNLSIDDNFGNSEEKVEALRNGIKNGTYKPNAGNVAKKMLDIISEREV